MREMIRIFLSVLLFSGISGGLLTSLKNSTQDRIEYQQLKFVKGPAIQEILKGCSNDPLVNRFKVPDGKTERNVFVGVFDGKPNTVALESVGKGFGGDIGVIVGINLDTDQIVGVGVTTLSETPGVGARVKTDPSFVAQFKDKSMKEPFKVKGDGGNIDAVSGATVSSRGVCGAVSALVDVYARIKNELVQKTKTMKI
jgi:H+/Na+-translocating ferredoxin:NAD+ oxidoreductase subunit G